VEILQASGMRAQPVKQLPSGQRPRQVAVPLHRIVVTAPTGLALALEVIDDEREPSTAGRVLERLSQRRAVAVYTGVVRVEERHVVENGRRPKRADERRLVDDGDPDGIYADRAARIHEVVGSRSGGVVQTLNEVQEGALIRVVLDLDEAHDVSVQRRDRRDDLGTLPHELPLVVAAPAVVQPLRTTADGPEVLEVVQHVEDRAAQVPTHVGWLYWPRVAAGVSSVFRRLDSVGAERVAEHTGNAHQDVASAETVLLREDAASRMPSRVGVLSLSAIVKRDPRSPYQVDGGGDLRVSGVQVGGRLVNAICACAGHGQDDLSVPVEVEVLADDELLREHDAHALEGLEVAHVRDGKPRYRRRRQLLVPGADDDIAHAAQRGKAVGFAYTSGYPHELTDLDVRPALLHEDAFGGKRVVIG